MAGFCVWCLYVILACTFGGIFGGFFGKLAYAFERLGKHTLPFTASIGLGMAAGIFWYHDTHNARLAFTIWAPAFLLLSWWPIIGLESAIAKFAQLHAEPRSEAESMQFFKVMGALAGIFCGLVISLNAQFDCRFLQGLLWCTCGAALLAAPALGAARLLRDLLFGCILFFVHMGKCLNLIAGLMTGGLHTSAK